MARRAPRPDLLDRRARLAAAHLLCAFDLPAEATAASHQMIEAAKVCPGLHMGELPSFTSGSRLEFLMRARELTDALIAEATGV